MTASDFADIAFLPRVTTGDTKVRVDGGTTLTEVEEVVAMYPGMASGATGG